MAEWQTNLGIPDWPFVGYRSDIYRKCIFNTASTSCFMCICIMNCLNVPIKFTESKQGFYRARPTFKNWTYSESWQNLRIKSIRSQNNISSIKLFLRNCRTKIYCALCPRSGSRTSWDCSKIKSMTWQPKMQLYYNLFQVNPNTRYDPRYERIAYPDYLDTDPHGRRVKPSSTRSGGGIFPEVRFSTHL